MAAACRRVRLCREARLFHLLRPLRCVAAGQTSNAAKLKSLTGALELMAETRCAFQLIHRELLEEQVEVRFRGADGRDDASCLRSLFPGYGSHTELFISWAVVDRTRRGRVGTRISRCGRWPRLRTEPPGGDEVN